MRDLEQPVECQRMAFVEASPKPKGEGGRRRMNHPPNTKYENNAEPSQQAIALSSCPRPQG